MTQMYFAGVDIGSTMTKVVIMDEEVIASIIGPTGAEHRRLANRVMEDALRQVGIPFEDISYVVATGYGRINVPFADRQITEITCHARGVASLFPTVRTAIDIGGQDAKGIKIVGGKVVGFVMNDKCAAGTGRFLEVIAEALGLRLEQMGELSMKSNKRVRISSTCTVFAEQEVVVTGGVAKNKGVIKAMEEHLGFPVLVPEEPLLTGAVGAALLGRELTMKALESGKPIERAVRRLEEAKFFT
jgi:predicted CoA-substrate-specific enzyme activase